jgi:6-phosphogluconolactonase
MSERKTARHAYRLCVSDDAQAVIQALAEQLVADLRSAIEARGRARLALAGGSTPRRLYELLATEDWRSRVDWRRVEVFYGDERCVALDAPESNHRMAVDALLAALAIPAEQVHPVPTGLGPEQAASAYAEELGHEPLDVVLLGIGDDGHTASLFPGGPELSVDASCTVVASRSPNAPHERVSLTLSTIAAARAVRFLVLGESKAPALRAVLDQLDGDPAETTFPAAMVRPGSHNSPGSQIPMWFVDRDAVGDRP